MAIDQISVFLENKPGELASLTDIISKNNIDLNALCIAETSDYGIIRLITVDSKKAYDVIKESDFAVQKTKVVAAVVPDKPGGLNEVLLVLAQKNIDISYMYSVFGKREGMAYMIFKVDDPDALEAALKEHGMEIADVAQMGI